MVSQIFSCVRLPLYSKELAIETFKLKQNIDRRNIGGKDETENNFEEVMKEMNNLIDGFYCNMYLSF